jgi:Fe-S-cluster-containing hydrogenase component 2
MKIKTTKEKCTGCRLCQQICTIEHFEEINPKKAALAIEPHFPEPGYFVPKVCVQCGKCAEACPVEAISRHDNGAYVIDPETCTDCGMCVEACPFGVVFTHPTAATPIICNFCMKCTEVCNTGAIVAVDE